MKNNKKKKRKNILIRFYDEEEIEILNKFRAICKDKKESFNSILKENLIRQLENIIYSKNINKNNNLIKEILDKSLDENIIPRFSGIIKIANEQNFIKIELINKKINFLINELGQSRNIDGRPIIPDINLKLKEKNWMLEEELKINEEIQIKKN
ncbi:hypothetical protein [Spiroplasma endosymbiont of Cantharis lateralis]|uniref:hypothetical protein n=1 Tax=Spiroplasma endosymbiont of Cantharis lateralis TaxID=3066277 RepID=UPI00313D0E34